MKDELEILMGQREYVNNKKYYKKIKKNLKKYLTILNMYDIIMS